MDVQTPKPIKISKDYIDFGIDGTIFDVKKGEKRPDQAPVSMPIHNLKAASKTQLFISHYFVNSIFKSILPYVVTLTPEDIPEAFPFKLSTSTLAGPFSAISKVYGA